MIGGKVNTHHTHTRAQIKDAFERAQKQDYYELLGVDGKADATAIRNAYFQRAKVYHVDRYVGVDLGEQKDMLDSLFARISEAYATLNDAAKRKDYDLMQLLKRDGLPTEVRDIFEAEECFTRALNHIQGGAFAEAIPDLEKAIAINASEAQFYAAYGLALYFGKQNFLAAEVMLKRAIALAPNLAIVHENWGRVLRAHGDTATAMMHFQKCLAFDPKNVQARREIRLIEMRAARKTEDRQTAEKPGFLGKLFGK